MIRTTCIALSVAALALAACGKQDAPPPAPTPPANAAPPTPPSAPPSTRNDVTDSYACAGSHRVDLLAGDRYAEAALSDGRKIGLEVVRDSAPRTYTGSGLFFELHKDGGATLTDEASGSAECTTGAG